MPDYLKARKLHLNGIITLMGDMKKLNARANEKGNVETLTKLTGRRPRFFRSGTAHVDEVAAKIVRELGMLPTNFSVNGDAGTTFTRSQIIQEMRPTKAGDIVIGHMNQPRNATSEGMAVAIPALIAKGVTFAHLRDVL